MYEIDPAAAEFIDARRLKPRSRGAVIELVDAAGRIFGAGYHAYTTVRFEGKTMLVGTLGSRKTILDESGTEITTPEAAAHLDNITRCEYVASQRERLGESPGISERLLALAPLPILGELAAWRVAHYTRRNESLTDIAQNVRGIDYESLMMRDTFTMRLAAYTVPLAIATAISAALQ